jgi:hypothetical protein
MSVTAGTGYAVSADVINNEQNQNVISHFSRTVSTLPLTASSPSYASGKVVGGELTFSNASRVAGTTSSNVIQAAGATGKIEGIKVLIKNSTPTDFQLILYTSPLSTTPTDNSTPVITTNDALHLIGSVSIPLSSFANIEDMYVANIIPNLIPYITESSPNLYGYIVTNGSFTPISPSTMVVSLVFNRD